MNDLIIPSRDVDEAFFSIEKWMSLPEGSREKELADVALRTLTHALFDPCPTLEALADPKLLERFLVFAAESRLIMDWTLHMHLAAWLFSSEQHRDRVGEAGLAEAMAAAASKFVVLDRGPARGVVVGCRRLPNQIVTAWKCGAPDVGKRIELLVVEEMPLPPALFGYFFIASSELEEFAPWNDIG